MIQKTVSITHGLITFWMVTYSIYYENIQYGDKLTNFQKNILMISLGYNLFDLIACIYYKIHDINLIFHHTCVIIGFISVINFDQCGGEVIYGFWIAEFSNFWMHNRKILQQLNKVYTKIHDIMERTYFITYLISRAILLPQLSYATVINDQYHFLIKLMVILFTCQSMFFNKEIFKLIKKRIKQYIERKKKGISYFWFENNPRAQELSYYQNIYKDKLF